MRGGQAGHPKRLGRSVPQIATKSRRAGSVPGARQRATNRSPNRVAPHRDLESAAHWARTAARSCRSSPGRQQGTGHRETAQSRGTIESDTVIQAQTVQQQGHPGASNLKGQICNARREPLADGGPAQAMDLPSDKARAGLQIDSGG